MQEAAAADPNITVKYLQSTTQSDYVPNINTFLSEKCGIIVTVGFLMGAATETAAKANPSQDFAIVDCSYASECLTGTKEATSTSWCSTPCRTASSAATWPRA
jgi:basic membrane protein A